MANGFNIRSNVPAHQLVLQALEQRARIERKRPPSAIVSAAQPLIKLQEEDRALRAKLEAELFRNNLLAQREERERKFQKRFEVEITQDKVPQLTKKFIGLNVPEDQALEMAQGLVGSRFENKETFKEAIGNAAFNARVKANEIFPGLSPGDKALLATPEGREAFTESRFKDGLRGAKATPSNLKANLLSRFAKGEQLNERELAIIADDLQDPFVKQAASFVGKNPLLFTQDPVTISNSIKSLAQELKAASVLGDQQLGEFSRRFQRIVQSGVSQKTVDSFQATLTKNIKKVKSKKMTPEALRKGFEENFGQEMQQTSELREIMEDVLRKVLGAQK